MIRLLVGKATNRIQDFIISHWKTKVFVSVWTVYRLVGRQLGITSMIIIDKQLMNDPQDNNKTRQQGTWKHKIKKNF